MGIIFPSGQNFFQNCYMLLKGISGSAQFGKKLFLNYGKF